MVSLPSLDVMTLCTLALGCLVVGLLGLMLCAGARRKSRLKLEIGLLLAPGFLGLFGWALGAEPMFWLPCLGITTFGLFLVSLRVVSLVQVANGVQNALRQPVVLWLGLCLLGVGGLVAQQIDLQQQLVQDMNLESMDLPSTDHLLESVETQWAATDSGTLIPLFTIPPEKSTLSPGYDEGYLTRHQLGLSMIRTGDVSLAYNCHGFVFADGRYWVRGSSVESILKENGYLSTSTPRSGDIVVYREMDTGQVMHTGIVRTVVDEAILVESKLGSLGRFIHTAVKHPYINTTLTYYHSRRSGHLLNGLDGKRRPSNSVVRVG